MSFADRLRARLAAGTHMDLLHEDWSSLDQGLRDDAPETTRVLEAAAKLDPTTGAAAVAPDGSYAVAVFGADGNRRYADALFDLWSPAEGMGRDWPVGAGASPGGLRVLRGGPGAATCCWIGDAASADRWALPQGARDALAGGRDRALVILFAPSRSAQLVSCLAAAFGLTRVEAELVHATLFFPTLAAAAADLGLGRDTAKDILSRAMAKVGVRRSSELVRKVSDLLCGTAAAGVIEDEALLIETFDLTPAEARVASRMGGGLTAPQAAALLGLEPETARGHAKSVLAKLGVPRTKDLSRLVSETRALARLAGAAEVVVQPTDRALRLIPASDGARRIAFLDYGPPAGAPVMLFHSGVFGRSLPDAYVRALQNRGLRPIVPQRPGFGLTDPAGRDYLATAAADLAALCERLDLAPVRILGRDGGVATALEFAARYPSRVVKGVLLNPLTPLGFEQTAPGILTRISHTMMRHPRLAITLVDLFRRQSRSSLAEVNLRRSFEKIEVDRLCLRDAAVVAGLIRDAQALTAHSSAGLAAEMEVFGRGWRPPRLAGPAPWTVAHLGGLDCEPVFIPWRDLPEANLVILERAGRLADFTHPDALAALIS
jgi:pimeloyl-ACP methyl ester carboxylesterase/DNA-binding CsgD family transcriptional regulator